MHDLMTSMEIELNHLVNLMKPPFKDGWSRYCWAKAQILEQHNPKDYAGLPAALAKAMQKDSSANGPQVFCTNE
jgi:hypothetical protein